MILAEPWYSALDGTSFQVLFVSVGAVKVKTGEVEEALSSGTSCLIPASLLDVEITPDANTEVIRVTVP